jgi:hypothetical protein
MADVYQLRVEGHLDEHWSTCAQMAAGTRRFLSADRGRYDHRHNQYRPEGSS